MDAEKGICNREPNDYREGWWEFGLYPKGKRVGDRKKEVGCSASFVGGEGIPPHEGSPPSRLEEQTADVPAFADCHNTALPLQCGDVWLCNLWKGRQGLWRSRWQPTDELGGLTLNKTGRYCHQEGETLIYIKGTKARVLEYSFSLLILNTGFKTSSSETFLITYPLQCAPSQLILGLEQTGH